MSALFQQAANDPDTLETAEWLDALETVIEREGPERAHFLLEALIDKARRSGTHLPYSANTAYINTIPPHLEEHSPGDASIEQRIRAYNRWNAMAIVVRANRGEGELGGHIASYASSSTLMEVGFNHFWRGPAGDFGGDLIYFQGHCSAGVYARAFLEGRLTEEQLINFRRDVDGKGVTSYPHPKLMPEFWQFPTVSMGLGPIQGIYQARFLKYLHARGIANTEGRKVWVFCGDGEMDEPESLGAIGLAAREKLDNLIFVVNCNLQRLDGPVRGNGKIIQELEGDFSRRRLERVEGHLGFVLGSAACSRSRRPLAARDGRNRRRRVPKFQGQRRRVRAQGFFRQGSEAARNGVAHERRRHLAAQPRWSRSAQDLCGVRSSHQAHRPADGHSCEDRQGLRHGQGRRRQESDASIEKARRCCHPRISRSIRDPGSR